jgi:hypothetical protein
LLAVFAFGALSAGCGPAAHAKAHSVPSASAAPSSMPSAAPTALALAADVDPLTGERPRPTGPVVVVKVDNAGTARKYHRGLGRAALVYQELVESGETRFAAIYSVASAGEVGPVRSVRETDIELLRPFGRVPVAFSGGNTGVKATFLRAVKAGNLLDASYDVVPQDYRLGERRPDARNFFTTPASVAKSRPGATAHDIGLRFGPLPAGAGSPTRLATAVFSTYVTVRVQYVPETGHYAIFQNKHEMPGVAPANVIVERVPIRMSKYVDVLGNRTPYTVTVGTGEATVLRDGRAVPATWQRPTVSEGTRFVDTTGADVPLRAGPTWVLLLPATGASLTLD